MSYTRATKMGELFADEFKKLQTAFAKHNITLDSPSKDGFLRCFLPPNGDKRVFFTADALPLNSASARALAHDKLATYQVLTKENVNVPRGIAFFASQFRDLQIETEPQFLIENLRHAVLEHFPSIAGRHSKVIVKPGQGSRGHMTNVCETLFEIELCANNILAAYHYGLVQEYVEGPEYRVVILNNQVILVYEKSRSPHETGGNISGINNPVRGDEGVTMSTKDVPLEVIDIALKASHILGLRYSGVDVCLPSKTALAIILEVNSNPSFDALEKDRDFDAQQVADTIAEAVLATYGKITCAL
jgi:glutathione synthase/RimK-type ligase-like ATP-grasp enzyme